MHRSASPVDLPCSPFKEREGKKKPYYYGFFFTFLSHWIILCVWQLLFLGSRRSQPHVELFWQYPAGVSPGSAVLLLSCIEITSRPVWKVCRCGRLSDWPRRGFRTPLCFLIDGNPTLQESKDCCEIREAIHYSEVNQAGLWCLDMESRK